MKMKKFAGIFLAIILMAMMTLPVSAAAQTGNLTFQNTVEGKEYDLYRVLDLTYCDGSGGDVGNYAYTVNEAFEPYFSAKSISDPITYINELSEDSEELSAFAQDLLTWAIENEAPVHTVTGEAGTTTVPGLNYGYYLLNPLGGSVPTGNYATMFALNTLSGKDTEIVVKSEYPTLVKTFADNATINDASIGDNITYKLASKVPDMTGYNHYYFVVKDMLSEGLKYNALSSITIGNTTLTSSDYDLEVIENGDGTTAVRFIFKDFLNKYKTQTGADVVITYTATLNDEAAIGTANENTAVLQYSNDPKYDYDSHKGTPTDPENPQPGDPNPDDPEDSNDPDRPDGPPTDETPESKTETYSTSLTITKKNVKREILTGATFKIEAVDTDNAFATAELAVDSNGQLTFTGLGAGTYTITETVTPNGYNTIDPITLVVSFDSTTKAFAATADGTAIDATGNVLSMDIINTTGSLLPSTGGMGTTLFYVLGAFLALGAVILLITKRRVANEK